MGRQNGRQTVTVTSGRVWTENGMVDQAGLRPLPAKPQPDTQIGLKIRLTTDDLMDALDDYFNGEERSRPVVGKGATGPEIARWLGIGNTAVRPTIKALLDAGKLELVTVERTRMDGRPTRIVGYRPKAKAIPEVQVKPLPAPKTRRLGPGKR